jgi:hypothetical protein
MVANEEGQLHELELLKLQLLDTSNQIIPTAPIGLIFEYLQCSTKNEQLL